MNNDIIEQVNPNGVDFADVSKLIDVFSSVEYDSLEKAAAEIIDNAIDANAKNILIYLRSAFNPKRGKETLSEIAFLDDGEGMTPGLLQHVLSFGTTSRTGSSKIGKFGIGMNQASLFVCKTFKVYSWTSENEVYYEEFDSERIKKENLSKIPVPLKSKLPKYITENAIFQKLYKNHGTLIIWSDFRENKISKPVTIAKRMKNEFGRIYRYYLNSNEVRIMTYTDKVETIHAIDPMFLMDKTDVLGSKEGRSIKCTEGEPLFEPFINDMLVNGSKEYDVPFVDNGILKTSKVILSASIIKEKFYYAAAFKDGYKQPGDTEIGAYLKEFQKGITVVRNKREIDFNYFSFYDSTNQPQDRWFKLEIQFNEELDEAFHVSNNKQHVELRKISDSKISEYKESEPNYPMWLRLNKDISKLLSAMRNRNKSLASGVKSGGKENHDTKPVSPLEEEIGNLDEFLNNNFKNKGSSTLNLKETNEKIQIPQEETTVSLKEKEISYNENQDYYDENNILVKYDSEMDKWINYKFDFPQNKYVVTFNDKLINMKIMNATIEKMFVILCVEICNIVLDNETKDKLQSLLEKYKITLNCEV